MRRSAARPAPAPAPCTPAPTTPAKEALRASLRRGIAAASQTSLDELLEQDAGRHRVDDDRRVLEELLAKDQGETRDFGGPYVDDAVNLLPTERDAFPDMLERVAKNGRPLTDKQRGWVYRTADRMGVRTGEEAAPVPRGREVETPDVLRSLPLAPPGRKDPLEPAKRAREEPCKCGAKVGYGGFHYPGAAGCRAFNVERREPSPEVARALGTEAAGLIKQAADVLDRELERRWGPHKSFFSQVPPEEQIAIVAAEPDERAFLEPLARNLGLPEHQVRAAYELALEQVRTSVVVRTENGTRRIFRTKEGDLDNCALVNGEPENTCPMCCNDPGGCPDKGRIRKLLDQYLQRKSKAEQAAPEVVIRTAFGDIRTGRDRVVDDPYGHDTGEPTPFDVEEDDVPF